MKNIFILASFILSSVALADHPIQVGKPVVDTALHAISQGQLVIDVRQEACDGYVKGAGIISVDRFLNSPEKAVTAVLNWNGGKKDTDVFVYCRSGVRAAKAIAVLHKYGFTKLHNLGGLGDYFDQSTMQRCN